MTPNPPRKHHYFPEFYTKRWCDYSGQMTRYVRTPSGALHRRRIAPSGIGFELDLYTMPILEGDFIYGLERELFKDVDFYGAIALEKLINGGSMSDDRMRTAFATFVLSLEFRSPTAIRSAAERFSSRIVSEFPTSDSKVVLDFSRLRQIFRLYGLRDETELGKHFINMKWNIHDVSSGGFTLIT